MVSSPRRRGTAGRRTPDAPTSMSLSLGRGQARVDERLRRWASAGFSRRLWSKDAALWGPGPRPGIRDRLGWLDLPERMASRLAGFRSFAEEVRAEDFKHALLLGMGGSSLAPEMFQKVFGAAAGSPELIVLDSTHPAAVSAVERRIDLERTLVIVSSKSGTTVEPLSLFRYFWRRIAGRSASPGRRFVAITDPGTPLEGLAADRGFRRVFEAASDVGGRFSALTEFGLVPASLIGLDVVRLVASAAAEARADSAQVAEEDAPGLRLGAVLGEMAATSDKLTFLVPLRVRSFPDWLEQLVAESTGKDGKGIVPVAGEPALPVGRYGRDRIFVSLAFDSGPDPEVERLAASLERAGHPIVRTRLADPYALGGEIFRWEVAVAATGSLLGVNPFDQPDVELAKELARRALASRPAPEARAPGRDESVFAGNPSALQTALDAWLARIRPKDYLAIQAYLAPDEGTDLALRNLRLALSMRTGLATTLGYGPRFLHSTGQLHKGGPDEACVLQLVDEPAADIEVPETDLTLGALVRAQALGDYQALRQRGRRVLRVNLEKDPGGGIGLITKLAGA